MQIIHELASRFTNISARIYGCSELFKKMVVHTWFVDKREHGFKMVLTHASRRKALGGELWVRWMERRLGRGVKGR
jgi:hypothetical protein